MKKSLMSVVLVVWSFVVYGLFVGSSGNLDYVKEKGPEKWQEIGFKTAGYDGYTWGVWGFNSYGGAKVYWTLKKIPDNGIAYSGYIQRWGTELHIYGPKAIDQQIKLTK